MNRRAIAIAYAVIGIATFGIAAERSAETERQAVAECVRGAGSVAYLCHNRRDTASPMAGLAGGVLWPLYWSWTAVAEIARLNELPHQDRRV